MKIIKVWCEYGMVLGRFMLFEDSKIIVMVFGFIFGRFMLIFWEYIFIMLWREGKFLLWFKRIICCNFKIFFEFKFLDLRFLLIMFFIY